VGEMQELYDQKEMKDELLDLGGDINDRIDALRDNLKRLGDSAGLQKKEFMEQLEYDLRLSYRSKIFRRDCIDLIEKKPTTPDRDASCRRWRELGMHELGYVFAVFHLELLIELATWSDDSAGQSIHYFDDAIKYSKDYHALLKDAYQTYERKRMSWFKPPKWSGGLNCNFWTGKCMVSDGQDCMLSSHPKICIKDGNTWPIDECTSKALPGTRKVCVLGPKGRHCYAPACDVVTNYCQVSGRVNPWENYILGTHMYYWMMKHDSYLRTKGCFSDYKLHILSELRAFYEKLVGLKGVSDLK